MKTPPAFSAKNPNLQIAWDATSLSNLMKCPRYYQLVNLEGWRGSKIDLDFGIFFAGAMERFYKARLNGAKIEAAMEEAVGWVIKASWTNKGPDVGPWGGTYMTVWHCEGTEKYRNGAGHAAKCPFAKKGVWQAGPHPSMCGCCGSKIAEERQYVPENKKKNRVTLIRAVIWYCLDQPETTGLQPILLPDGSPAVEINFRLPLPLKLHTGEEALLCGYLGDRLAADGPDEVWIVDNKTTASSYFGDDYFDRFAPSVQFDTYDLAGSILFPDLPIKGVMNDAVQLLVDGARFNKRPYRKTEGQREEHLDNIIFWLEQADKYAELGFWPMNKSSCPMCPMKEVCALPPERRAGFLKMNFQKGERWNPLKER